jgi:hypothetical protein
LGMRMPAQPTQTLPDRFSQVIIEPFVVSDYRAEERLKTKTTSYSVFQSTLS